MDTLLNNFTNMEVDHDNIDILSTNLNKNLFVNKDSLKELRTKKAHEVYEKVIMISESIHLYNNSELYLFFLETNNMFQNWYKELFYIGWDNEDYSNVDMQKILLIKYNIELFNKIYDCDTSTSITLISSIIYDLFVLNNIF